VGDVSGTSLFLARQLGLFTHKMCVKRPSTGYGVASISRLLKIIGVFCNRSILLQGSFAKETYNFKEPTHRSHPTVKTRVYKDQVVSVGEFDSFCTTRVWSLSAKLAPSCQFWRNLFSR